MSAQTQQGSLFGALRNLADEISTEKTAAAPTPSDPGGYQGASTHPTTDVENRGQGASEGSRSSENVSDVNADQGAPGTNKAKDATPGQQDSVQLNIGTNQSATGEDPSIEDDYKGGKDDPGSDHPASTDNDSLDGHKYANASVGELRDVHSELSNSILADIATGRGDQLTKAALAKAAGESATLNPSAAGEGKPTQPKQQTAGQAPGGKEPEAPGEKVAGDQTSENGEPDLQNLLKQAADAVKNPEGGPSPDDAYQAGYELAAHLGVEKQAAEQAVEAMLEETLNDAHLDADLFGSYYTSYMAKTANLDNDPGTGEDHNANGDSASGASEAGGIDGESETSDGGGDGGGEGGGPPSDPAAGGGGSLGDLLGGGADPGGMMGGGEPGGDPLGGGDPMAGGQPSEEEVLMELVAALQELGISPEELAQAAGGAGGAPAGPPAGPDGGMPPMEGGSPPLEGAAPPLEGGGAPPVEGGMSEGMKLASVAKSFQRSGKYRFKTAADNSPQRVLREQMKGHILELVGR